ncbi:hypothetical protein BC829DRAFT_15869 [Chytridium lagenaria]|nr:hypothetical protein BC829DRAFT_15869 [Chytridium lagenaria]
MDRFEMKICFCYFSVTYTGRPTRVDETDMFQVLMSETIIRSIEQKLVSLDQILSFDPEIIVMIPRLTILNGLVHMPDIVNMTDHESSFRWFRSKAVLLQNAQKDLLDLQPNELTCLERLIADSEDSPLHKKDVNACTDEELRLDVVNRLFIVICGVADEIARAREFVLVMQAVFRMHCLP